MSIKFFNIVLLLSLVTIIAAKPEPATDGKYRPSKVDSTQNNGKYKRTNSGRYVPMHWPYMHIHDNRELGKYVHVHIPYDGGFGPYSGDFEKYRYLFDNSGDYSLYTVSKYGDSDYDPFNTHVYDIPKPEELLEYGFPDHTPTEHSEHSVEKRSISTYDQTNKIPKSQPNILIVHAHNGKHVSKNLIDSQTTSTTTPRPRIRYDDEGKWRIIRQELDKNPKKYDYLYLTENGIYAEEQGKTVNKNEEATGTSGKGYYYYTGDDGELYQVNYTAGEEGFLPMAEHLHPQLKKALEFLAAKNKDEQAKAQQIG